MKNKKKTIVQFSKYSFIGCTGVFIDFCIFYFLTNLGVHYLLSNCISVSSGIANNFYWNRKFTFKVHDRFFIRLICFYFVGICGLIISSLILYINNNYLNFDIIGVKLFTIFFVAAIQFILNKYISFNANLLQKKS